MTADDPATRWKSQAKCAEEDPELFYSDETADQDKAKLICYQCPVIEQCFDYALRNKERHGIWGGTDRLERKQVFRRITRRQVQKTRKGSK